MSVLLFHYLFHLSPCVLVCHFVFRGLHQALAALVNVKYFTLLFAKCSSDFSAESITLGRKKKSKYKNIMEFSTSGFVH